MTPALVLLHGTRMRGTFWRDYPDLLPGVDVRTPDLVGHGERLGEDFTWDGALQDIDDALPAGPVVLAGHSLGGYLAMAYAARHPRRLAGLGVIGASAVPRGPGLVAYQAFARLVPAVGAARVASVSNAMMRALARGYDVSQVTDDGAGYAAMPAAWAAVTRECRPELLRGLDLPVLLLNGQLDQLRLHTGDYAAACRDVEVVTVPLATHFMPLTHPEECAAALRRLLDRAVEASR